MHATNTPCSYQIPHLTHTQQMQTRKPSITNAPHLKHIHVTKQQEWILQHDAQTHSNSLDEGIIKP